MSTKVQMVGLWMVIKTAAISSDSSTFFHFFTVFPKEQLPPMTKACKQSFQRVENPIVGAGAFDSPIVKVMNSPIMQKITMFYRRGVGSAAPYTL